ncbi:hypothetical protein J0A67_03430 [Algoriphagus aestuariicola]|jgi:hypothetical protein|uniref:Uncharacterized protein n=1 Tax=Algoriphagus aestuariicola TaxID=1852016 RepID=A0ABS3BM30_9BACT|nr:hypothetical protein [Algoriphagus aestuariicola]MBN7799894.1 hypothetical protein [Algoriphagus aestuariicola]
MYERNAALREDVIAFLDWISQESDFEVFLVYNGELSNLDRLPSSVRCIPNPTQGYDLNCYIRGFLEARLTGRARFVFLNNSVFISNPEVFMRTILSMSRKLEDSPFVAFSLSHEIRKHFQSFLFGIDFTGHEQVMETVTDTCVRYDRAFTREEVIGLFELKSYDYVVRDFKLGFSVLFQPGLLTKLKGYAAFLLRLGFLDNMRGLIHLDRVNFSLFLKSDIERQFGFRKIKSTTVLNKLNES